MSRVADAASDAGARVVEALPDVDWGLQEHFMDLVMAATSIFDPGADLTAEQRGLATYMTGLEARDRFTAAFTDFFSRTTTRSCCRRRTTVAFPHGTTGTEAQGMMSAFANLAGLPVLTVPAGRDAEGLPVGVQFVGPRWSEIRLLDVAGRSRMPVCCPASPGHPATDGRRRATRPKRHPCRAQEGESTAPASTSGYRRAGRHAVGTAPTGRRTEIGMDGLRLTSAPLVPEVRLFLAEDPTILWARLQAGAGGPVPAPFWASAWTGGQAVARYVLDHPETVAGRRVLDLASGSGIVAIAAALAGAALVTANDIDPGAAVAIRANAEANAVDIVPLVADILDDGDTLSGDVDVVLAGDVLYNDALAPRVLAFLTAVARQAAVVLVGDPGRGRVPSASWDTVATYPVSGEAEDSLITGASVLRPAVSSPAHARAASTP